MSNNSWKVGNDQSVAAALQFADRRSWRPPALSFHFDDDDAGLHFVISARDLEAWANAFQTSRSFRYASPRNPGLKIGAPVCLRT
jgi:hypothetical protein